TMRLALSAIAAVGLLAFGLRTSGSGGQSRDPFSLATLKGTHGFLYNGTLAGSGPIASAGRIVFDGRGHLSAVYNTTIDGTLFLGSFAGTYTVNANGTGTVTLDLPRLGIQSHGSFMIVNDGNETFFTSTDPGQTITGVTKRLRPDK